MAHTSPVRQRYNRPGPRIGGAHSGNAGIAEMAADTVVDTLVQNIPGTLRTVDAATGAEGIPDTQVAGVAAEPMGTHRMVAPMGTPVEVPDMETRNLHHLNSQRSLLEMRLKQLKGER